MALVPNDKLTSPFPIELIEAIIDHLHDHKSSLQACSLVARQWLPSSRLHLIPGIEVNGNNYQELLEILENRLCRLPPSVQILRLANTGSDQQWIYHVLPALCSHFTSVTGLSLDKIYVSKFLPNTISRVSALQTSFPDVETLHLTDCVFQNCKQHAAFLSSFKSLKDLKSERCRYAKFQQEGLPLPSELSPLIKQLNFDGQDFSFMRWLETQTFPHLEVIVTGVLLFQNVNKFSGVLSRAGSSLQYLHFGFGHDFVPTPPNSPRRLDLSHNTSLKQLVISLGRSLVHMPAFLAIDSQISSFVLAVFSSISSKKLDTIALHLFVRTPARLTVMDWEALDNLIEAQAWGENLNRFLITLIDVASEMTRETFMDQAETIIYSGLPQLARRGLLSVNYLLGSATGTEQFTYAFE